MIDWQPMETAPKDRPILVWYDHAEDTYFEDAKTGSKLTAYGTWCEGGDCRVGRGFCAARWCEEHWESTGDYGEGYVMPGWWFEHDADTLYECAVNPTHWADVQPPTKET